MLDHERLPNSLWSCVHAIRKDFRWAPRNVPLPRWRWKQSSTVQLCTCIILHSEHSEQNTFFSLSLIKSDKMLREFGNVSSICLALRKYFKEKYQNTTSCEMGFEPCIWPSIRWTSTAGFIWILNFAHFEKLVQNVLASVVQMPSKWQALRAETFCPAQRLSYLCPSIRLTLTHRSGQSQ